MCLPFWAYGALSRLLKALSPTELTPEEIDTRISTRISKKLKSYDGLTHQAMFTIPKHIRQQLAVSKRIITDKQPISAY